VLLNLVLQGSSMMKSVEGSVEAHFLKMSVLWEATVMAQVVRDLRSCVLLETIPIL
jgi:hypothetical protein